MAIRLGEFVVYGELRNIRNYSTFGTIVLRGPKKGHEKQFRVELTGNCGPDLAGKYFRFMPGESRMPTKVFRREDFKGFRDFQIGTTGTMTAQGWVRDIPCSPEEFARRVELGEPPPTEWMRHLYLEWYSQNGRMLIEMPGAIVEECIRKPENDDDEGDWIPIPNRAPHPDEPGGKEGRAGGVEITAIYHDGKSVHIENILADAIEQDANDDLERILDCGAREVERDISGDDAMWETRLLDDCIDKDEETPVASLLGGNLELPDPDNLNDDAVEAQIKGVLARLALLGVALHVCEHYSVRECYRLLKDEILPKHGVFERLVGTGWMQHCSTSDYCAQCEAEAEAKLEALDKEISEDIEKDDGVF